MPVKCFLLFSFVTLSTTISAQVEPVNSPGDYIFYEVVEADSSSAGLLYHNAVSWLKKGGTKITISDSLQGIVKADDEFLVYKEAGVLKKISGKVTYKLEIDVKDNKYRYHYYDFIFHYYGADRFHKISDTGKKKRLDDPKASGWQKLWDSHRSYTSQKITENIKAVKIRIIEKPVEKPVVQKKEVKWGN